MRGDRLCFSVSTPEHTATRFLVKNLEQKLLSHARQGLEPLPELAQCGPTHARAPTSRRPAPGPSSAGGGRRHDLVPAFAEQGTGGIALPPPPPPLAGGSDGSDGSAAGYPNASASQAENLFTSDFSQTVDSLAAADPPDLSGQHPPFLDDHTALISPGGDGTDLVSQARSILEQDQRNLDVARADLEALLESQHPEANQLVTSTDLAFLQAGQRWLDSLLGP
jgi:hypothetical protein